MPEENPETVARVLQYLYKFDYEDSPVAENTADPNADTKETLSEDQSNTSPVPTSTAEDEDMFDLPDRNLDPADESTQNPNTERLKEVSCP